MGIVWRGRDELLHRDVAVKQVQITALTLQAEAEVAYQRTLREARTAARLSHPAVVTVFDVVEEDGSPWIIMESSAAGPWSRSSPRTARCAAARGRARRPAAERPGDRARGRGAAP